MSVPTPAQALWNQREVLASRTGRLRELVSAIARGVDLTPPQWIQLLAFALEFSPDLIVELGRDYGNSTCCFLEAASILGPTQPCRVVSLCRSDIWERHSRPALEKVCTPAWFAPADVRRTDILACDWQAILGTSKRVLLFWDAHGFEIAGCVLGKLMPLLEKREHVVALHDMTDMRYNLTPPGYGADSLWAGQACEGPYMHLGHVCTRVAQSVNVIDFTTRNRIPFHSAEESLHPQIGGDPHKRGEMQRLLGDLFRLDAHWFWFTLAEAQGKLTYPVWHPPATAVRTDPGQPAGVVRRTLRALAHRVRQAWPA